MHGGDIYRNNISHDFSVNINPLGIPESVKMALHDAVELSIHYPDIRSDALVSDLAEKLAIKKDKILLGNGASELFTAVMMHLRPAKTLIATPSFSGYRRSAIAAGSEIVDFELKSEEDFAITERFIDTISASEDIDAVFIANPNNPTGKLIEKKLIERIVKCCQIKGIKVILDECFMVLSGQYDGHSMIDMTDRYQNLLIVRSFTKTYAIPGVRLGYLICSDKELMKGIAEAIPEWNISCFAEKAGVAALKEETYVKESVGLIAKERKWLSDRLAGCGFKVVASDADFILFYTEVPLYEMLLKKRILIRDCSNFEGLGKGWYRIAVKKHDENKILMERIEEALNGA